MDWLDEVKGRLKRRNQILFSKDSGVLQGLIRRIDEQGHRTVVLWALEFADETARKLRERYPDDGRPEHTVAIARSWAAGKVKMPEAQRAILQVHAMAKGIDSPEDVALCHAVGQACGTVHAPGHAIGFPIYELTALVRRQGIEGCREAVERRMERYFERIDFWRDHVTDPQYEWADFLRADE